MTYGTFDPIIFYDRKILRRISSYQREQALNVKQNNVQKGKKIRYCPAISYVIMLQSTKFH